MRTVYKLRWARPLDEKPSCIPTARLRGVKAAGLKYEKSFGKAVPAARHGQWFEFCDANGPGFCQPDYLLRLDDQLVVLECKLSLVDEAFEQLEGLYFPVLEKITGFRPLGVVVTKNIRPIGVKTAIRPDLISAIDAAKIGLRGVFHWLGSPSQIWPSEVHRRAA